MNRSLHHEIENYQVGPHRIGLINTVPTGSFNSDNSLSPSESFHFDFDCKTPDEVHRRRSSQQSAKAMPHSKGETEQHSLRRLQGRNDIPILLDKLQDAFNQSNSFMFDPYDFATDDEESENDDLSYQSNNSLAVEIMKLQAISSSSTESVGRFELDEMNDSSNDASPGRRYSAQSEEVIVEPTSSNVESKAPSKMDRIRWRELRNHTSNKLIELPEEPPATDELDPNDLIVSMRELRKFMFESTTMDVVDAYSDLPLNELSENSSSSLNFNMRSYPYSRYWNGKVNSTIDDVEAHQDHDATSMDMFDATNRMRLNTIPQEPSFRSFRGDNDSFDGVVEFASELSEKDDVDDVESDCSLDEMGFQSASASEAFADFCKSDKKISSSAPWRNRLTNYFTDSDDQDISISTTTTSSSLKESVCVEKELERFDASNKNKSESCNTSISSSSSSQDRSSNLKQENDHCPPQHSQYLDNIPLVNTECFPLYGARVPDPSESDEHFDNNNVPISTNLGFASRDTSLLRKSQFGSHSEAVFKSNVMGDDDRQLVDALNVEAGVSNDDDLSNDYASFAYDIAESLSSDNELLESNDVINSRKNSPACPDPPMQDDNLLGCINAALIQETSRTEMADSSVATFKDSDRNVFIDRALSQSNNTSTVDHADYRNTTLLSKLGNEAMNVSFTVSAFLGKLRARVKKPSDVEANDPNESIAYEVATRQKPLGIVLAETKSMNNEMNQMQLSSRFEDIDLNDSSSDHSMAETQSNIESPLDFYADSFLGGMLSRTSITNTLKIFQSPSSDGKDITDRAAPFVGRHDWPSVSDSNNSTGGSSLLANEANDGIAVRGGPFIEDDYSAQRAVGQPTKLVNSTFAEMELISKVKTETKHATTAFSSCIGNLSKSEEVTEDNRTKPVEVLGPLPEEPPTFEFSAKPEKSSFMFESSTFFESDDISVNSDASSTSVQLVVRTYPFSRYWDDPVRQESSGQQVHIANVSSTESNDGMAQDHHVAHVFEDDGDSDEVASGPHESPIKLSSDVSKSLDGKPTYRNDAVGILPEDIPVIDDARELVFMFESSTLTVDIDDNASSSSTESVKLVPRTYPFSKYWDTPVIVTESTATKSKIIETNSNDAESVKSDSASRHLQTLDGYSGTGSKISASVATKPTSIQDKFLSFITNKSRMINLGRRRRLSLSSTKTGISRRNSYIPPRPLQDNQEIQAGALSSRKDLVRPIRRRTHNAVFVPKIDFNDSIKSDLVFHANNDEGVCVPKDRLFLL